MNAITCKQHNILHCNSVLSYMILHHISLYILSILSYIMSYQIVSYCIMVYHIMLIILIIYAYSVTVSTKAFLVNAHTPNCQFHNHTHIHNQNHALDFVSYKISQLGSKTMNIHIYNISYTLYHIYVYIYIYINNYQHTQVPM